MRSDQIARLEALSEKLADVVLEEADPDAWPGAGKKPAELSQQERGDRYWCKKVAAASFALLERAQALLKGSGDVKRPEGDDDLDQQLLEAEREAKKALDAVKRRAKKTEFDKRTHGKSKG